MICRYDYKYGHLTLRSSTNSNVMAGNILEGGKKTNKKKKHMDITGFAEKVKFVKYQ